MKKNDEALIWKEIETKHIVENRWIDFRESTYRFPDGRDVGPFYSYSRRDYAIIVATDEEGNYICVRQFRQGIKEVTTEFPAGGIERKDGREYSAGRGNDSREYSAAGMETTDGREYSAAGAEAESEGDGGRAENVPAEDALEAAKRELLEETGYESDDWQFLMKIPSNATIADNYAYVFRASGCRKVAGQALDETEFVDVVKHTADEIEDMIYGGLFKQAMHVMAWLLADRKK